MSEPEHRIYEAQDGWTVDIWPAAPKADGLVAVMICGPGQLYASRVGIQSEAAALAWAAGVIADEIAGRPWRVPL